MKSYYILILLFNYTICIAQSYKKLDNTCKNYPTVIINDSIIGNLNIFSKKDLKKIKSVKVIKNNFSSDTHFNHYNNLGEFGIISIKTTKNFRTISLTDLNKKYNLPIDNPIYLDGYLIENLNYSIVENAIVEIQYSGVNQSQQKKLNILTSEYYNIKPSELSKGFIIRD